MKRKTRWMAAVTAALGLLCVSSTGATAQTGGSDRKEIADLLKAIAYGVPTSPAFALLPEQPEEVNHLTKPADLTGQVGTWFSGTNLRGGAALDYRPLARVGDLDQYRQSIFRQAAFRSVLSAGSASGDGSDVLLAAGIRIPLLDRGDPRLDSAYEQEIANILARALLRCPPNLDEATDDAIARCPAVDDSIQAAQDEYTARTWNAMRLDFGLAGSARAHGGSVEKDSVMGNQAGVWLGVALPLGQRGQLMAIGKNTWARADSSAAESGRSTAGARIRWLPLNSIAVSVEAAQVWTRHPSSSFDDSWTHLAAVAEIPLDRLGALFEDQVIGVAYGGDIGRDGESERGLSLRYSFYRTRLIKR
jgi:hypothetical protein